MSKVFRKRSVTKSVLLEVNVEDDSTKIIINDEEKLPSLSPSSILVQVRACGLASMLEEKASRELLKGVCPKDKEDNINRLSIGQDIAGTVRAVGSDVSTLQVGDDVVGIIPLDYNQSGCSAYVVLQEFDVAIKPPGVSFENAAACIGDAVKAYTALHYLGRLSSGDTVLVLGGATSLGSLCIQLARHWGARVLTTISSTPGDKQHLSSLGLETGQILEPGPNMKTGLMLETGSLGADIIVDHQTCAQEKGPSTHEIISCLAVGGRWVTSKADLQLDPPNSRQLLLRCASVGFLFEQAWMLSSAQQGRYQHILMDVMEKVATKTIMPNISQSVQGLESVPEMLHSLGNGKMTGKVVLSMK